MTDQPAPNNRLNNLSNREWLKETKSFWLSREEDDDAWTADELADLTAWLREARGDERAEHLLGQLADCGQWSKTPPRSKLKALHPATFSELDVERLIRFFTKEGQSVLDPFVGSGSSLLACHACGRLGTGLELIATWADVTRERLAQAEAGEGQRVIEGDALTSLRGMPADHFDFLVTSPPYWSILKKRGMKVKAERSARGLPTQYSDQEGDLGNLADYEEFLDRLAAIFAESRRVLRPGAYAAVIVSDFRHGPQFVLYHADLARKLEAVGLVLKGITILLQDNKNLYPLGMGHSFVSNIHHQYILVHQKPKQK